MFPDILKLLGSGSSAVCFLMPEIKSTATTPGCIVSSSVTKMGK